MSSLVHSALCVARKGAIVDLEISPSTATDAHFPFSRFFGLWLLHEAASTLVLNKAGEPLWRSQERSGGPIAGEVSFDELMQLTDVETPDEQLMHPPSPAERQALRARKRGLVERFVNVVSYADVKNWQPMLAKRDGDRYLEPVERKAPRFGEACQSLQQAFESALSYGDDDEMLVNESALPRATLRIEATSDRWTQHLEPGMGWGVYAFDGDAGFLL
jgi:hypothetical protein